MDNQETLNTEILRYFATKCAGFLKNISRYQRDSFGQYRWAWTGEQVLARISPAMFEHFQSFDGCELVMNGKVIGRIKMWNPYAYTSSFIILNLDEAYQYNSRVVTRFAQMGGYVNPTFDMTLLDIQRETEETHQKRLEELRNLPAFY